MKKTLLFKFFALSLFMLFSLGAINAQNLLLNGDMESWDDSTTPTSWTKVENTTQETTIVHNGTYSAKHTGGTSDLAQSVAVTPGQDYEISIWYYIVAADDSDARIWSYWKDSEGNSLDDDVDDLRGPDGGYFPSAASWQNYTVTLTAPAAAASLYFELRTYSGAVTYWDDMSVSQLSDFVATDLFFSEYVEGAINGNNRVLEIFNGTGAEVDLSAYTVKQSHNGTGWGVDGIAYVLPLTGTLASGDVYVIANEGADAAAIAAADVTFAYSDDQGHKIPFFTGDDALGLFKADALIDVIGVPEVRPTDGWDVAGVTTATYNHTLIRKSTIIEGNTDWATAAGTDADNSEWVVFDNASADYIDNVGTHSFGDIEVPTTYAITFNVDMSLVADFDPNSDVVYISGDIAGWAEPGTSADFIMTDADENMTYSIVLEMDIPGGDIAYKFFLNAGWGGGEWDGDPNRAASITENTTLNHIFGNRGEAITVDAPFFQDFGLTSSYSSISLAGWTNANTETGGAVDWTGRVFDDDRYAQISSYNSASTGADQAWLITPGINMDNTVAEVFSFDVNIGYWTHDGLTVKISTDFDQTVEGIATATWTDVTADFTIPSAPSDTYGTFASAGTLDVSAYSGTMYIAFVYDGNADASETTTYQIDNVSVTAADGPDISNVSVATAPFFEGGDITVSWAWNEVDFVKVEAWLPIADVWAWTEMSASTESDGSFTFTIPSVSSYTADNKVRVSSVADNAVNSESSTFEIVASVSIFDIQSTTSDGDASDYDGQQVLTSGIVTAIAGGNFWIQEAEAMTKDDAYPAWSGIFAYSTATADALTIGDDISLVATIDEYYGVTEIINVLNYVINSQGNALDAVAVTAADATEAYESTLITILNAEVTSDPNSYGEFTINDGTADYVVDDKIFEYIPTVGEILEVTGVTTYANSAFKIYPRSADDIVVASSLGFDNLLATEISIYPNPNNGKFFVQMGNAFKANTKIEVFNVVGMKVFETFANMNKTEIDLRSMKQGVYYIRVDDGENILTQKIMKQ